MHKIGIMQGRIYPDSLVKLQVFPSRRWKQEFPKSSQIGFEYIEFLYDRDENPANPLVINSNPELIVELARKSGLRILSLCADYFTKYNFLKDSHDVTWDKLSHLVGASIALGATSITIPFFDRNMMANEFDLEQFLVEAKEHIKRANKSAIHILIETTLSAPQIESAIRRTNSAVKVCYDLGNATALGFNPVDEISFLRDRIGLIHIKDRQGLNGPNVMLGKGSVDLAACFAALKEIAYQGNFTLETAIGDQPDITAAHHFNIVHKLTGALP